MYNVQKYKHSNIFLKQELLQDKKFILFFDKRVKGVNRWLQKKWNVAVINLCL